MLRQVPIKVLGGIHRISLATARLSASAADALSGRNDAATLEAPAVSHPENARFRDIYSGRRAFVLGNGPSLATHDLSVLRGELVFTMNAFDRHSLARELRPLHHFLADPLMNTDDPEVEEMLARMSEGIGESPVFIPGWEPLQSATLARWREDGRLWVVPTNGVLADEAPAVLDMCTGFPGVQSTSQLAMMAAMFMGCNPVYLLGLDSDWAATPDLDRHFYDEATIDSDREEHTPRLPYHTLLECTLALWKGYANLREYCEAAGIEVFNCATGGLLDVYPRRRLQDVLDES